MSPRARPLRRPAQLVRDGARRGLWPSARLWPV